MPLLHVALLAVLQGLAEVLPISRSGHEVVARLWLDAGASAVALEGLLHIATAAAFLASARRRLAAACADGVRAIARPAMFAASPGAQDAAVIVVASAVSLITGSIAEPRVEMFRESPTATGVGLIVSGLAIASTALAPRAPASWAAKGAASGPSLAGAMVVGISHGIAVFPGASRVGAALALLLWMGVRPRRAVELAFLITVPALLLAFARGLAARNAVETGTIVLGVVLAHVAAMIGSESLRSLADRRRVARLALWTIPLGLAMLAYARALRAPS
jgi:undecaprenyl-diphosphatase